MAEPAIPHTVRGDATGLSIPTHVDALREAGVAFLTAAFQRFGSLAADNRIVAITRLEECPGGSTGRKYFLSIKHEHEEPGAHTDLFVKFSRDFQHPARDRGRYEMEAEVQFAPITRLPGFPIDVPIAYFADYDHSSGSGILITQRVAFGEEGIEPHQPKCLDHDLADPLPYYRAIVVALARLAAAHKSGKLSAEIEAAFPFDAAAAAASDPIRYDTARLHGLIVRYADFAATYPQLVPPSLTRGFFDGLMRDVEHFLVHEPTIKRFLQSDPDLIALSHWNANIDNAWFWNDAARVKHCGLMDWGRVRQMNVAYAIWGCLSGADTDMWDRHCDELLNLFVRELHRHGGPLVSVADLRLHTDLYVAMMGIAWLMEAPEKVLQRLPAAGISSGLRDPLFRANESARTQLHISTLFLHLWKTHDFTGALNRMLERGTR